MYVEIHEARHHPAAADVDFMNVFAGQAVGGASADPADPTVLRNHVRRLVQIAGRINNMSAAKDQHLSVRVREAPLGCQWAHPKKGCVPGFPGRGRPRGEGAVRARSAGFGQVVAIVGRLAIGGRLNDQAMNVFE